MSPTPRTPHFVTTPSPVIEQAAQSLHAMMYALRDNIDVLTVDTRTMLDGALRAKSALIAILHEAERRSQGGQPRTAGELHAWLAAEETIAALALEKQWTADRFHEILRTTWIALPPDFAGWTTAEASAWARELVAHMIAHERRRASTLPQLPHLSVGARGPAGATDFTAEEIDALEAAHNHELRRRGERARR